MSLNRWLHGIVGLTGAITSILFLVWFSYDFTYFFKANFASLPQIRVIITLFCIFFSWFYLSRGLSKNKINKFSTASLIVLCATLLLSCLIFFVTLFFMPPIYFGPTPPPLTNIEVFSNIVQGINIAILLPTGILASFILAILSLIKSRR